jgi:hypothetical protein
VYTWEILANMTQVSDVAHNPLVYCVVFENNPVINSEYICTITSSIFVVRNYFFDIVQMVMQIKTAEIDDLAS